MHVPRHATMIYGCEKRGEKRDGKVYRVTHNADFQGRNS